MSFRNFYVCYRCGHEWDDIWPAMVDDDCPQCGARHVSPYHSEDELDDTQRHSRQLLEGLAARPQINSGLVALSGPVCTVLRERRGVQMKSGDQETEDQRIGKLIRILRHKAGLSQTELGQALGVTFQQIQKYEKGSNRVASSTLSTLSKSLGVSPGFFFEKHKVTGDFKGGNALALLADKRAQRMLTAFGNIKSSKMKDAVLNLVEKLAASDQPRNS